MTRIVGLVNGIVHSQQTGCKELRTVPRFPTLFSVPLSQVLSGIANSVNYGYKNRWLNK
jgi:hypothetical protein